MLEHCAVPRKIPLAACVAYARVEQPARRPETEALCASKRERRQFPPLRFRLRIWGSEVRIFPGAPVISIAYGRLTVLIIELKRCLER